MIFRFPPFFNKLMGSTPPVNIDPFTDELLELLAQLENAFEDARKQPRVGFPLDEDLFEVILHHMHWIHEAALRIHKQNRTPTIGVYETLLNQSYENMCEDFQNKLEQIYMEAVYRWLKNKKDVRSCSI